MMRLNVTEAEYTFRLHKPIIPLRLEARYCPDGWLGALCGNNLIYDFSVPVKHEDSFHGLMNGLTRYSNSNEDSFHGLMNGLTRYSNSNEGLLENAAW